MFDLQKELAELVRMSDLEWDKIAGKSVLVTGATGLVGCHCVCFLLEANRAYGLDIRVVALVRSRDKADSMLVGYSESDGLSYVLGDLLSADFGDIDIDYVVHAACPTASSFFAAHPVDTADAIVLGTKVMLDLAVTKSVESFVYVSSMEVYGDGNAERGLDHPLTEKSVGYVNPLSIRSCYPEGKRMAEQYCCAYAHQHGVPAKVVRLAQTFGPGIPKDDTRVFAQFARCAMRGEDIVLKTTGASTRMYLYTTDAVLAIFAVLLKGASGKAYNAANESTYSSILEMAHMVAEMSGDDSTQVRVEVDPDAPYPPEHHLPLDVSALRGLGWAPHVGLAEMYERLMAYLA